MSIEGCQWEEIFFLNIIRIRGKGVLIDLMRQGILNNLSWTQKWQQGLPSERIGFEQALRDAESKLHEAEEEESRKCREFHRCPHCQQPFIVAKLNCGQFVCGRDTHDSNIDNGHGCGRSFRIADAPRYEVDISILDPL